jgi:hypothetical protein
MSVPCRNRGGKTAPECPIAGRHHGVGRTGARIKLRVRPNPCGFTRALNCAPALGDLTPPTSIQPTSADLDVRVLNVFLPAPPRRGFLFVTTSANRLRGACRHRRGEVAGQAVSLHGL